MIYWILSVALMLICAIGAIIFMNTRRKTTGHIVKVHPDKDSRKQHMGVGQTNMYGQSSSNSRQSFSFPDANVLENVTVELKASPRFAVGAFRIIYEEIVTHSEELIQ